MCLGEDGSRDPQVTQQLGGLDPTLPRVAITKGGPWQPVAPNPKVGLGCTGKCSWWGLWWCHSQV